ncbi:MAG: hypothetical protein CV087_20180 [Candidatus Brocadia sp. WS118]|nr:MAG: hypothetical protein CV087_20180 [Candidatus Brocadia sp. WS118]
MVVLFGTQKEPKMPWRNKLGIPASDRVGSVCSFCWRKKNQKRPGEINSASMPQTVFRRPIRGEEEDCKNQDARLQE